MGDSIKVKLLHPREETAHKDEAKARKERTATQARHLPVSQPQVSSAAQVSHWSRTGTLNGRRIPSRRRGDPTSHGTRFSPLPVP